MEKSTSSAPAQAAEFSAPRRILLGPGPSTVDPRILRAMGQPLVGHLDPFFLKVMDEIQVGLRSVFETNNPLTLAVSGTGSAAMEAAVANMVEPGDAVLVCINGFFSGRLAEMARRYGGVVHSITRPWGQVFTPEEVDAALDQFPAKVVAVVHAETSTGARQPLEGIVQAAHRHGALLIADTVTSLGGIPVQVDRIGIDVAYSATQKCLGCPPGLGPITLGPRAVEALQGRKTPVTNWYLDLTLLNKYWSSERVYHHTAPISSGYALCEGLRMIAEEGLEARWKRHQRNAELLWAGLEESGLKCHVEKEFRLPTLTTVKVPEGVDEALLRRRLLDDYGIEIAGGLGELKGKVWRVGLMGASSNATNVQLLLEALKALLK